MPNTNSNGVKLVVLLFVIVVNGKQKVLYEQQDTLLAARCDVKCMDKKVNKHQCIRQCLNTNFTKPGECPGPESLSPFDSACLEACSGDFQCPGTSKCCRHQCGVTCQPAWGLETIKDFPPIPSSLTLSERRRGRVLLVRWTSPLFPKKTLYVLEERHHAGRHFSESRLGGWTARHRTMKHSAVLRQVVKPGRWYQFRVAAVTENGTRGWSEESVKFITSLGPRPPAAPPNMTVGPLRLCGDGSLCGELRWTAPTSDLPIQRYKVFWSRRLHGATALDSVLVQHQTVSKDQTNFELKKLQANSLYFLQVQALAQYGKERLKGEKAALVLNTTNYTNVTEIPNSAALTDSKENKNVSKVEGLHIQKVYWNRDKLQARVVWRRKKNSNAKYTVTWWAGPCPNSNKNVSSHLQMAVTTKSTQYDIYDLDFMCKYRVSVREVTSEGMKTFYESSTVFTTPSCSEITKSAHKYKPDCSIYGIGNQFPKVVGK